MSGARLPGAPERDDRVVCHVDMDCFYASCERRREPALEGKPVVVGMGFEPGETHGAVATASYEAREYGVESAQAISEALERLPRKIDAAREARSASSGESGERSDPRTDPELDVDDAGFYRTVDMAFYQSVSEEVKAVLREAADTVREVSIDEAYLDVTAVVGWDEAEAFARNLRERIGAEAGVPASVGVAPTMSTAKIASDHDKPDGLVVVEPGESREFLAPLDVAALHGVGPVTAQELRGRGIETAGDVAAADPYELEQAFGERGRALYRRARGEDDREVEPMGEPKSLSRESAFTEATDDHEDVRERARTLAADVAERASAKGALYATIGVKVVTPPHDIHTRARSLSGPVDDSDLLESVALDLLAEFAGEPVRKLGVRVAGLSFTDADQVRLDTWDRESGDGAGTERDDEDPTDSTETTDGTDATGGVPEGQASLADFSDQ
jgi:DNA polymerase IV (DinB-like DNA polymerase)